MTRKQKRFALIGSALGVLALAVGLVLYALRDNVVFFYGPAELVAKHVGPGTRLRIGGLVKDGTLVHLEGKSIKFQVTDGKADVPVSYTGLLPDLFKEGQGVVAEGALDPAGVFKADFDPRQARRTLHAPRSRRRPQEAGRLEGGRAGRRRREASRQRHRFRRSAQMIVETGHYALALALALALMQTVLPFWGARARDGQLMATARPLALMQFAFVALAYAALTYAHVVSDFSLVNVVENSHSTKPMLYKISGVWGNHEGSMMLWVLILTLCGAAMALFARAIPPRLLADSISVQGFLSAAFLLFILLTSDPFTRLASPPIEGNDLNPILQDPASPSIRRCSISAMSASPSCFRWPPAP